MDTASAQYRIEDIARRFGLAPEASDVSALAGKNPEDVDKFIADIEAQSDRRTKNVPGGGAQGSSDVAQSGSVSASAPADDWFQTYAPAAQTMSYSAPARPAELATPYVAPVWSGGDFAAPAKPTELQSAFAPPELPTALQSAYAQPSMSDVEGEDGYKFGLDQGILARERSAAAQGSLLGGGQQKALTRYGTDYATTKYGDAVNRGLATRQQQSGEYNASFGRSLSTRQQQEGEYNTSVGNAFDQYRQRYQGFLDSANLGMQARGINEGSYQSDVGNSMNSFGLNYKAGQDSIANARNSSNDYWSQQMDLARNSLTALSLARPSVI